MPPWARLAQLGEDGEDGEDAVDQRLLALTAADIMMAGILRGIRKTDLMVPFPRLRDYFERCQARPAWQRTLGLYAERLRMSADDIRYACSDPLPNPSELRASPALP